MFVAPQAISGSERNNFNEILSKRCISSSFFQDLEILDHFVLVLSLMKPQTVSGPESLATKVAGDDDSFDVVCLNVIFHVSAQPLLSTHFASNSKNMSLPIGNFVLTFLHQ